MRVDLRAATWLSCVAACGGRSTTPTVDSEPANAPRVAASPGVDANVEGTVTVTGTRGGQPFSARGAIALFDPQFGPGIPSMVSVGMPENFDVTCDFVKSDARSRIAHPYMAQLELIVQTGGPPVRPGVYSLPSPDAGGASGAVAMTATGSYNQLDADCGIPSPEYATSGSVVISAIDRTAVSGSFELAFPNGDFATGQFSAPVCVVVPIPVEVAPLPLVCVP